MTVAGDVQRIAVIGAGLMGHGIALEFAVAGHPVRVFDSDGATLATLPDRARRSAQLLVEAGRLRAQDVAAAVGRIEPARSLQAAVRDADVVVEAVFEDLALKQQVFAALGQAARQDALLLSNSSAFMPSELAASAAHPERVAVAHYFDPPFLLPLVELVRGPATSDQTIERARALYVSIGKRPVVIDKELPGFVGNRLQSALGREARAIVDAGIATPDDVDNVVKYGFGRRLAVAGPFQVWELIGWDLVSVIGAELWKDISRATSDPPPLAKNSFAQAATARSAGSTAELRARMDRTLVELARWDASGGPSARPELVEGSRPAVIPAEAGIQAPSPAPAAQVPAPTGRGLRKHPDIDRVAVIGAGLMGHGIALEFAAAGYEVTYTDPSPSALASVPERARKGLELLAEAGRVSPGQTEETLLRMSPASTPAQAATSADLVIEAVSEDLALKRRLFAELDAAAPADAIILSNTSTFLPSALASATNRPGRVAVAHYFNPPHLLPAVELVRGPQTTDATVATARAVFEIMGKRPALVQKEALGFIGNRLQFAMFREALSLVQKGVISAPDLDEVVRDSFGRRLPSVGLFARRTLLSAHLASRSSSPVTPTLDNSTDVPAILRDKVRKGELGIKTGKGFYDWTPESAEALRLRIGRALVEMARWDA